MAWILPKAALTTSCFQPTSPPDFSCNCRLSNRLPPTSFSPKVQDFSEPPTASTVVPASSENFLVFATKASYSVLAVEESISYKTREIFLQPKGMVEATMAREMLLKNEKACIGAAAAEAVTLAKAAVIAAKDAAAVWEEIQHLPETNLLSRGDLPRLEIAGVSLREMPGIITSLKKSKPTEKDSGVQCSINEATLFLNISNPKMDCMRDLQSILKKKSRTRRKARTRSWNAQVVEKCAGMCPETISARSSKLSEKTPVPSAGNSDPTYLHHQLASSNPLTPSAQATFCEGVKDLANLVNIRAKVQIKIGKEPTPAEWAEAVGLDRRTLHTKLLRGLHCKQRIIKGSLGLVVWISKRYMGKGLSLPDLVQEGIFGLIRGAEKYDYKRGFKFSTYVYWWIRHSITDAITKKSRTIRLPGFLLDTFSRITAANENLHFKLGRAPSVEEIAESLHLSVSRVKFVIKCSKFPRSINQQISRDDDRSTLADIIADPGVESTETRVTRQLLAQDIDKLLETLGPREQEVVRLRYGLDDGISKTRNEVAGLCHLSRERIRQIENVALAKLKMSDRSKDLRFYLYF